ncbi:eclosion hormone [Nephila pilipes]|uniref:Eclosion hormone n=1 Tax=Nephila pilipes TaxID=299642 RepID=A0A8X6QL36_NEPPI|nr:eclosion hormone [Nephila pilipes]
MWSRIGSNLIMKTYCLVISLLLLFSASDCVLSASVRTCIINCGQCKKMYGEYFLGQRCAEECIKTGGFLVPDCNEPTTIMRYLSKLA